MDETRRKRMERQQAEHGEVPQASDKGPQGRQIVAAIYLTNQNSIEHIRTAIETGLNVVPFSQAAQALRYPKFSMDGA